MTARVAVAGAGALGLATACVLAEAGCRVTVFDPAPPGANASGIAAGMLAPVFEATLDPAARPHFDLLMAARDLWPAFAERLGLALDRSSALALGRADWVERVARDVASLGVAAEPAEAALIRDRAPDAVAEAGLLVADDWRLDAAEALAALARKALEQGASIRREPFVSPKEFDISILATGASKGLAEIAPELAVLQPIKGHILRATGPLSGVVRGEGVYAVEAGGGRLIGATMEAGRADADVDPDQAARLRAAGAALFPSLAEAPLTAAAGVRAATPDGLPLAGPSRTPGVLVAAGARRNGWLLAPLVAQVIKAHVLGGDPGPWRAALDPGRV